MNPHRRHSGYPHSTLWVRNLLHLTPSTVHLGSGTWLLTVRLHPHGETPSGHPVWAAALQLVPHASSWLQGAPACLSIALISDPRAPAGPASTCSDQGQNCPRIWQPFVLRPCSSCREQVAGKRREGSHQGGHREAGGRRGKG